MVVARGRAASQVTVTVDYGNRWRDVEVPMNAKGAEIKAAAHKAFRENAMPHFVVLLGANCNGSFSVIGDVDVPWQNTFCVIHADDND